MTTPSVRPSDLAVLVPPGWVLDDDPALIRRYGEAPDLPGPAQGVGPMGGPISMVWCPQCQAEVDCWSVDTFLAHPLNVAVSPRKDVASLLSLSPCGHAFRVLAGQTLLVVREPAA